MTRHVVDSEALAKKTVLDESGSTICLGTLWEDRPAALVFVRHFG